MAIEAKSQILVQPIPSGTYPELHFRHFGVLSVELTVPQDKQSVVQITAIDMVVAAVSDDALHLPSDVFWKPSGQFGNQDLV